MNAAIRNAMQRNAPVVAKATPEQQAAAERMLNAGDVAQETPTSDGSAPKSKKVVTSKETKKMATAKKAPAKKAAAKKITKKAKTRTENRCQCGCGSATFANFAPGHDARLVGKIKRGELKSLTAFQAQFAKNHGIKLGEAKKAPKKVRAAA